MVALEMDCVGIGPGDWTSLLETELSSIFSRCQKIMIERLNLGTTLSRIIVIAAKKDGNSVAHEELDAVKLRRGSVKYEDINDPQPMNSFHVLVSVSVSVNEEHESTCLITRITSSVRLKAKSALEQRSQ